MHPPNFTGQTEFVYLSSVRSSLAREKDLAFRPLDGGEGGVIHLGEIKVYGGSSRVGEQVRRPTLGCGRVDKTSVDGSQLDTLEQETGCAA